MPSGQTAERRSTDPLAIPQPVAGDPNLLVENPDPNVRAGLARRLDVPPQVVEQLLADEDPVVRVWAAAHPHAPRDQVRERFLRETRTALG